MITHNNILQDLIKQFNSNKLHQSLLFVGQKGVGKASLIKKFIEHVIANNGNQISKEQQLTMMKSYSHPDIFNFGSRIIQNEDAEKMTVDGTRETIDFMSTMPSILPAKFVIIDSINEMNNASCNAILKILEEPRKNAYFLIVCHNISDILPTIISRCFRIAVNPISFDETVNILSQKTNNIPAVQLAALAVLSNNSPGIAIDLIKLNGLAIYNAMLLDIHQKTANSATLFLKISALDAEKLFLILINRLYMLLLQEKQITIIGNEEPFIELLKKSNNIQNIINNFSEIIKIIQNITRLNNGIVQSWHSILMLLSI